MLKKSLIFAIAITCFNLHASNNDIQQKFQEFEYSIDPARKALENFTQKLNKKEEEKKSQISSTNKYWYSIIFGAIIITGIYLFPKNQTGSYKK